jgi:hypothetical protein
MCVSQQVTNRIHYARTMLRIEDQEIVVEFLSEEKRFSCPNKTQTESWAYPMGY